MSLSVGRRVSVQATNDIKERRICYCKRRAIKPITLFNIGILLIVLSGAGCSHLRSYSSQSLNEYYIDFTEYAKNWDGASDENGIPLYSRTEDEQYYHPVSIAHYALGNWNLYLQTGQAQYREIFLKVADWFRDNLTVHGDFGIWEYQFDFPRYQLESPWPSAMSQGEGISVLMRAFQLTQDERYLNCAMLALGSFESDLQDGGIRYRDGNGHIWYEEYPAQPEPPHVLNGFIFALLGLYDYYRGSGQADVLDLFNAGILTLEANLELWDLGFWSRYDLTNSYGQNACLFRLVSNRRHPESPHPIAAITLRSYSHAGEELSRTILDLGTEGDTSSVSSNGSRVYFSLGYQDWGESYELDGMSVRNYENQEGRWAHAPFEFATELQSSQKYVLEVYHKDATTEPAYLEMYVDGVKYVRFGQLAGTGDGAWKCSYIEVPTELLLMKTGTSDAYHRMHIQQLELLYAITGKRIFHDFGERFLNYLDAVWTYTWWGDITYEIEERQ